MESVSGTSPTSNFINQHSVFNNKEVKMPPFPDVPVDEIEGDFERDKFYKNFIDIQKHKEKESPADESSNRNVFILRHGERVDFVFGSWVPYCYDDSGNYERRDLNMPKSLPERKGGATAYHKDSPLTNIGLLEARLIGEAMRDKNINIDQVYCSPSYRCVQTCDSLLRGLNRREELPIKVEPGLFEWLGWYPEEYIPEWMTISELTKAGFNIDESHVPLISEKELKENKETCDHFYLRSAFLTRSSLSAIPRGNILLIGHSSTLDACSRELIGKKPRSGTELTNLVQKIPFCSLVQVADTGKNWEIVEPQSLSVTHSTNQRFDWKVLL